MKNVNEPIKLFEVSSEDWQKGMSRNIYKMSGGLWRTASAFDPFEELGYCYPAPTATAIASTTGATASFITPFVSGGVGYVYAHGSTKLYQINTGTNAVTDATANVTTGAPKGAGIWRNKYVYTLDTEARKIELGAGTDTQLLAGLTSGVPHIVATGADLNEYITNGASIARLVLETGTTGNATSVFTLETGQVAKDLASDGRYLVIISDNNPSTVVGVRGKCRVSFWDMARGTADQIYEIQDTCLQAIKYINGLLYIIGQNNIYVCTAASGPQLVYSFTGYATVTISPTSPSQVTDYRGVLYWASTGQQIYAFGNPYDPKSPVLFNPYATGAGNISAIASSGNKFFAGSDSPQVYEMTGSVTRSTTTLTSSPIHLGRRFRFAFAKVVLQGVLGSGESVTLNITDRQGGGVISDSETKTFATDGGKQVLLFFPTPNASSVTDFEEIYLFTLSVGKCPVERIELWGVPLINQYSY